MDQLDVFHAVNAALEELRAISDAQPEAEWMACDLLDQALGFNADVADMKKVESYILKRWKVANIFDVIDIDVDWVAEPLLEGTQDGPVY